MSRFLPTLTTLCLAPLSAVAATLYSESFDDATEAKVLVNKGANTEVRFLDYSNFNVGSSNFSIPEAPRRISGSPATKGVLLRQLYDGTARIMNLIAADGPAPGGVAKQFSGDYTVSFDAWLNLDPTATVFSTGTTEILLFGVGLTGTGLQGRSTANPSGTWGWLAVDCGFGTAANSGDAMLRIDGTQFGIVDELSPLFPAAFPTLDPPTALAKPAPHNRWVRVDIKAGSNLVTVSFNGQKFFENVATSSIVGNVFVGYQDPFTGSNSFSPEKSWCLIDNLVVEESSPPTMLVTQTTAFTTFTGTPTLGVFVVENRHATNALTISDVSFSGSGASAYSLQNTLPVVIPAGNFVALNVQFNPSAPNGVKTATMTITSDDPQTPTLAIPNLQARRSVAPGDLVAHYKLDETSGTTLADSSGNNANAVLTIRPGFPVSYGLDSLLPPGSPPGTSLGLLPAQSGTQGNYANSPALHTPSISISCWVKTQHTGATRTLFNRDPDFDGEHDEIFSLVVTPSGTVAFISAGALVAETPVVAPNDEVHHIVLTHRDDDGFGNNTAVRTRIFVDGLLQAESLTTRGFGDYPINIAPTTYIGTKSVAGRGFQGQMDDIQFYSRELAGWEAVELMRQGGQTTFTLMPPTYQVLNWQLNTQDAPPTIQLEWNSYPGDTYRIESSTDLQNWTPLRSGITVDPFIYTHSATVPYPAALRQFFRITRE